MVSRDGLRMFSLTADCPERADRLLAELLGLSRTRVQRNIERENILRNGTVLAKNSFSRFRARDLIEAEIEPLEELSLEPEEMPLSVLYENGDFLVVDKPAGLVVHPAPGHPRETLMNGVIHHLGLRGGSDIRPGLVHRIDKDTSGLLVIACSPSAFEELSTRFARHDIERHYLALAWGRFTDPRGTIRTGHARDPHDRRRFYPAPDGRTAVTRYEVIEQYPAAAFLRLTLETGRTHQIRMHLKHIGHPVVNDDLYGGIRKTGRPALDRILNAHLRQMLHAADLGFVCGGRQWRFSSPMPDDMAVVRRALAGIG